MRTPTIVTSAVVAFGCICGSTWAQAEPTPKDRERLVVRFIDAFNAKDIDAMARLVTDDVQWLSIDGKAIAVETGTKQELVTSMGSYFKSCPSCRSSLSGVIATSHRLGAIEVARWESANGKQERRGVSVYEFSGSLISRVFYFPAEP